MCRVNQSFQNEASLIMFLTSLSLTNFRLFNRLEVDIPRHLLLIAGDNAQGKTSFLEGIHYLSTLDSPQVQSDRQLINFLALKDEIPVSRLVAGYQRSDGSHKIEIRLILEPGHNGNGRMRKEILIDGIKRPQAEVFGQIYSVLFLPQMMKILEGGPEERRRFLDNALSQAFTGYARQLSEYSQAISQRNALLKQIAERGGNAEQLNYWDDAIAMSGAMIIHTRINAIQELESLAGDEYKKLTREKELIRLVYLPAYNPFPAEERQFAFDLKTPTRMSKTTVEEIHQGFKKKLMELRNEEIARGVTTIGPHRDDLRILGNGIDLGIYGSRGQTRSALMALKLAELDWLREKTGEWPVLLLDETLAELDHQRRVDLLNTLKDCDQAILTTTDLHLFSPEFTRNCTVWHMSGGKISPSVS